MRYGIVMASMLAALLAACGDGGDAIPTPAYSPPAHARTTRFPARQPSPRILTIEGATDVTFMQPFFVAFQRAHPDIAIVYRDMLSTDLLARALAACGRKSGVPDLYLSIATDHLVRLANDGCGRQAPRTIAATVPYWKEWRHEVFAFALEPAVFVFNRARLKPDDIPRSHLDLVDALRLKPALWSGRTATYDIEKSGAAFNYAELDARSSTLFGRLVESLGRSGVKLYCCSNEMVDAVARGDVLLAYNVQLSYAYAAQRRDDRVGVIVPEDYQAVQTRSVMIARDARQPTLAAAFLDFLLSDEAETIDARLLTPPRDRSAKAFAPSLRQLNQADVSSALLRLQDPARRATLIREWRQAIRMVPAQ